MDMIFVLLPLSLVLGLCGLCAFIWSLRKGQLDDLDTPAVRMLLDDTEAPAVPRDSARQVQERTKK